MKIAIYYVVIFMVAAVLYMTAERAMEHKKSLIAKFCYFGIFLEILFLI